MDSNPKARNRVLLWKHFTKTVIYAWQNAEWSNDLEVRFLHPLSRWKTDMASNRRRLSDTWVFRRCSQLCSWPPIHQTPHAVPIRIRNCSWRLVSDPHIAILHCSWAMKKGILGFLGTCLRSARSSTVWISRPQSNYIWIDFVRLICEQTRKIKITRLKFKTVNFGRDLRIFMSDSMVVVYCSLFLNA